MRMCYFWAQNVLLVLKKNFMVQTIIITFIYLLALFKIAHLPQWEFFSENLLIWLVPVIHAYLHAKNPSQILMIKEYWNLIGQEPFLALTWEPDFSQAWSFRRMLMNHKNFTQIPDKINGKIFFKNSRSLFLGHFWPFLLTFAPWRFSQKNPALSLTTIYGPLTPC